MSLIKASNRSCSAILIPRAVRQRCDPEIAITNKQACPYQLADKADRFVSVGGQRFDVDRGEVSTGVLSPNLGAQEGDIDTGMRPYCEVGEASVVRLLFSCRHQRRASRRFAGE
jgi:hypothetical protein